MTDILRDAQKLREVLERVPVHKLNDQQQDAIRAYLKALANIVNAHVVSTSSINVSSPKFQDSTAAAEKAADQQKWDVVLDLAYMGLSDLPGDTGWKPKGGLPRPK